MKQNICLNTFFGNTIFKKTLEGKTTLGTSAWWEAWEPEFDLQNPCRERKESQCLLTSMCALVYTHKKYIKIKKKIIKGTVALTFNLSTWEAEADVSF